MLWYLLPILLVLIISANILWDWRRSGRLFYRPLPRPFRDRQSQEEHWNQTCTEENHDKADALLRMLCKAFSFSADDRYRFAPTDRITDVYKACYPKWRFWKIADRMEIESLTMDI